MNYEEIKEKIEAFKIKYELTDFGFDTECIYDLGDLTEVLRLVITRTLAEMNIEITEEISKDGNRFVATLKNQDNSMQIFADTNSDWLPADFFDLLESMPTIFQTNKKYFSINPLSGLTGQEAWYFCGTEENLRKARAEGLPILLPGEVPKESDEFNNTI